MPAAATRTARKFAAATDTALAALHAELYATEDRLDRNDSHVLSLAGAKYYYRGRQRVTDMRVPEALAIVRAELAKMDEWRAANSTTEADGYVSTKWTGYAGIIQPYAQDSATECLERRAEYVESLGRLADEIEVLQDAYTGWSRFFLVTSSPGHIHRSMSCSTCRPTTRYGWLPAVSGANEAEAVAEYGPTLCTVCYPSAPTEYTIGKKISAAKAAKLAAEAAAA